MCWPAAGNRALCSRSIPVIRLIFALIMTVEQLKELRERVAHLDKYLKVAERKAKYESDRQLTLSPGFWDDNERATTVLKEQNANKFWIDLYEQVKSAVEDFAILFDFWKEGEATEDEARKLISRP